MKIKFLPILCGAGLALPLSSQAATVTWGSISAPVNDSSIVTTGVTGLVGANFTTTTSAIIANGVTFTAVNNNSSANIGGGGAGITVATSGMDFTVSNANRSNVTGNFAPIMDAHTGTFGGTGTITLSGLVDGTQYQIQFFASTNGANDLALQTITGGAGTSAAFGNHAASVGKTLLGTFTASGTTQVLTIQGGEPTANALTIGAVVPEPSASLLGGLGLLGLLRRRRN